MPIDDEFSIDDASQDKSLWESEFGHIIQWCQRFWEISIGVHFAPTAEVSKRMKIFMFLADKAAKKDELQDPYEYFDLKKECPICEGRGCRYCNHRGIVIKKANRYARTFDEQQVGDYVNYLHQRVLDLKNQKMVPNYLRSNGTDGKNTTKDKKLENIKEFFEEHGSEGFRKLIKRNMKPLISDHLGVDEEEVDVDEFFRKRGTSFEEVVSEQDLIEELSDRVDMGRDELKDFLENNDVLEEVIKATDKNDGGTK